MLRETQISADRPSLATVARPKELGKIDVSQLLQGNNEVCLVHRGIEYRLRITRQGKLLLTK